MGRTGFSKVGSGGGSGGGRFPSKKRRGLGWTESDEEKSILHGPVLEWGGANGRGLFGTVCEQGAGKGKWRRKSSMKFGEKKKRDSGGIVPNVGRRRTGISRNGVFFSTLVGGRVSHGGSAFLKRGICKMSEDPSFFLRNRLIGEMHPRGGDGENPKESKRHRGGGEERKRNEGAC